ncbi:flippase [Halobaculum sp. P14]|uniref:flippase n=1 Tax=Halobaculum sp. P14 TaxID=3421638 RepID=UPI003EB88516
MTGEGSAQETLATSGLLILGGNVFALALAFGTRIAGARLLGPDRYGVFVFALSVVNILILFAEFGLREGITRTLPRIDDVAEAFSSGFLFAQLAAVVVTAAALSLTGWFVPKLLSPDATETVALVLTTVPLYVAYWLTISGTRGINEPRAEVMLKAVMRISTLTGLVVGAAVMRSVYWAAMGWVAGMTVTAVASAYVAVSTGLLSVRAVASRGAAGRLKSLVAFSLPLLLVTSLWRLMEELDTAFIGAFQGSEEVGLYDPNFIVARLLLVVIWSFEAPFLSIFSSLHDDGDREGMRDTFLLSTKWITYLTLPVFLTLMVFNGEIIVGVFGEKYAASAHVLPIISLGFFSHVVLGMNREALIGTGDTRAVLVGTALAGGGNVVLNLLLVPTMGMVGAAIATATAYGSFNVLASVVLYREYGVRPVSRRTLLTVVVAAAAFTAGASAFRSAVQPSLPLVVAFVALATPLHLGVTAVLDPPSERERRFIAERVERFR